MFLSSGIQVSGRKFSRDSKTTYPKKRNSNFSLATSSKSNHRKPSGLDLRRTLSNRNVAKKVPTYSITSSLSSTSSLPKSDLRNSLSKHYSLSSTKSKPASVPFKEPIRVAIDNDLVKVVTTLDKKGYRVSSLTTEPSAKLTTSVAHSPIFTPSSTNIFTVQPKSKVSTPESSEFSDNQPPSFNSSACMTSTIETVSKNSDYDSFLSKPNGENFSQKSFHSYSKDHTGRAIFTISVYNLNRFVDLDDLRTAFSKFGALADVVLLVTPSGMSMGQAHISYYDKAHCQAAIDHFNNKLVDKQYLKIEHVKRPVGLQYTLSNMMMQNQQESIAKGTSFLGAGLPFPARSMFPPTPNMFGSLGWSG